MDIKEIEELVALADELDSIGEHKKAAEIDALIQKKADGYGNWRANEEIIAAIEKLRGLMIEHEAALKPDLKKLLGVALSIAKSELMEPQPGMGGFIDQPMDLNQWEPIDLPVAEAKDDSRAKKASK